MGASEIKAGGAYIEIGQKGLSKTVTEIKKGLEGISGMSLKVGAAMFAAGSAALAPLISSAKTLADYGENIGKLASKTGMSTQMLSGLAYAAKSSNISIGAISSGIRALQKNGLSEEMFLPAVDAISGIADSGERAQAAMKIFGRAGVELLPIIEGGSDEISRMMRESDKLGLALSGSATDGATKLDTAFDRLSGATEGLKLHIGSALAPMLTEATNRIIDIVIAAREWIDANPEMIQSFAKTALVVAAAGAGLLLVGGAVMALMSPAVMITGAIVAIGTALLAVTDITGTTSTGFGELFNSVRIGGTGLGTWFGAFAIWMEKLWNNLTSNIHYTWARTWLALKIVGYAFADVFLGIIQKMAEGIAGLNNLLPKSLQMDLSSVSEFASGVGVERDKRQAEINHDRFATDQILSKRDAKNSSLDQSMQQLFIKDPQDNTKGVHVDTDRARAALGGIGDKIWDTLAGGLGDLLKNVPHTAFEEMAAKPEGGSLGGGKPQLSAVGSFSGFGGGALAATGVFNQQLQEAKESKQHLAQISKNTGGQFGGFGFAG